MCPRCCWLRGDMNFELYNRIFSRNRKSSYNCFSFVIRGPQIEYITQKTCVVLCVLCCAFLLVYGLGAAAFSLVFGMRGATFSLVYAIRAAAFSLVYASVPLHSYWYVAWVLYCCLLIGLCHKGCRLLIGQLHPEYVALSLNVKNGISRLTDRIRWIRTEETW